MDAGYINDEDSYDSEEERLRARQQAAHRGAALRAEQAAQAQLLHTYRARQRLQQQLEQDALLSNLAEQHRLGVPGMGWQADSDAGRIDATASGQEQQARVWRRLLQQHEHSWAALEAASSSQHEANGNIRTGGIAFDAVPWPPLDCEEYLAALAAREQHQQQGAAIPLAPQQQQQERRRQQRRAYTRACLRWHPDKFVSRFGHLLLDADRQRILQRVQQLSQGLNQAWEALQQEQQQQQDDGVG